ncbi:MAG: TonB-dependent receptor plug domain-containing protein [Alistipes sp.]|nr:TonB-dependent receptor plug domain-containing protein [Alistipes sp.]
MRRLVVILALLFVVVAATAEERTVAIREVTVLGHRPMKEIGVQQTKLDSVTLKENVALSLADVLSFNSSIFVKSYGRATLSTVSFRGTSPSHTQVSWNGMKINNPMLGMTDFSMIPSYFIDDASLLAGTSSVNESGGGLGGAVKLSTRPAENRGFGLQFIQGVGSFKTFDEFLRLTYGSERWQVSTRAVYMCSANDYKYRNHDKKENIYDEEMNIVGQYFPIERNRSGAYRDLHILQEVYYNTLRGDRFSLNAWYIGSNRELAMLTTDYGEGTDFDNRQREQTLRAVLGWDHLRSNWRTGVKAGYIYSWMAYDYKRDPGNGIMTSMTRSRSNINTLYLQGDGEYHLSDKWLFTANIAAYQHFVLSRDKNIILQQGGTGIVGYDKARVELSGVVSAKYRPIERFGVALTLREEMFGNEFTPLIPALFLDGVLSKRGSVILKASVSRNYRFPTLNDRYFLPGGNPDLRPESGFTYDAELSFKVGKAERYSLSGSAAWFESYIDDWIQWLPTTKGFFSPRNVKRVHSYGVNLKANLTVDITKDWKLALDGTFAWTPSINIGEKISAGDQSVGKQLPYVPRLTSNVVGRLSYRSWAFLYKWCYYSTRYTMSSNDISLSGTLPPYFMSNISLEKSFDFRWADLSLKGTINNLFNEEYLSVLARPMPGINFELFLSIRPKW